MSYQLISKPSFLESFSRLSRASQKQCMKAVSILEVDPHNTANKNLERLKNWNRLWSYHINDGDRLLYAVYPNVVQLLDVGGHEYIYNSAAPKIDQYDNLKDKDFDFGAIEDVMDPNSPTTAAQVPHYPVRRQVVVRPEPTGRKIPMAITQRELQKYSVPAQYHAALLEAVTEEDLLEAVEGNDQLFETLYRWLYHQPELTEIAQQPNYILNNPDDLGRYADGDLLAFLLWLDADQKQLINFSLKGPTLVKGGPGSGKSTVALYRVRELRQQLPGMEPSILYTTYTRALTSVSTQLIEQLLGPIPESIRVSTLDKIARAIVVEVEGSNRIRMANGRSWSDALASARALFSVTEPKSLAARMLDPGAELFLESYLIDEMQWVIEGQGITTRKAYRKVQRTGRSYPLNPDQRKAIWKIYEAVTGYFDSNRLTTWDSLRRKALEYVKEGRYQHRYDYVLVDEAQDLTPVQLELCLRLCESPAGLFLTADQSQSIYNKGFSWQRVHEDLRVTGRTRHLRKNYRTTLQIAEAAHRFLHRVNAGDADTLDQQYVHHGSKPVVYAAESSSDQVAWLSEQLHRAAATISKGWEAVAVLVPGKDLGYRILGEFTANQVPSFFVQSGDEFDLSAPSVKIMTMHAAKGLEFPIVALPFLEEGYLPRDLEPEAQDYIEKLNKQRRLFYVAATRAMVNLFVTYNRANPSSFIDDLSPDYWQFVQG